MRPAAAGPSYEPDPVRHVVYKAAITRQVWLYERLISPRTSAERQDVEPLDRAR